MKNIFTCVLVCMLMTTVSAQITHTNYGNCWVIPLNANHPVDINDDGIVDIYVNQKEGELGFRGVYATGCIAANNYDETHYGSRKMRLFAEGELIQLNYDNDNYYMEDDDWEEDDYASAFSSNVENGLAAGWENKSNRYIGFAIIESPNLEGSSLINGWMKISIDIETQSMTIKEIAYSISARKGEGGIKAGDTGDVSVVVIPNSESVLNTVLVSPNPAKDFVKIALDYTGEEDYSITILNNIGQEVERYKVNECTDEINLNTASWTTGMYYLQFETKNGVRTERLSISK